MISNIGSEFQLKPINFFPQLASLDIVESDDFEACLPRQGNQDGQFDYTWNGNGNNYQYSKAAFTLSEPLPEAPPVSVSAAG